MTLGAGIAKTPLPKGFLFSGINCGVRRYRPDLGLIYSETDAATAAVFTTNRFPAEPVKIGRELLPSSNIRAIITNSGQANAATGELGHKNALAICHRVAEKLKCDVSQIIPASTGVIGNQLDMEKILPAIAELTQRMSDTAETFATAILTTDLVPKTVSLDVQLKSGPVRITGVCKGSGMIHPMMATMLGYIVTDLNLEKNQVHQFVKEVCDESFNMISVDGDCSTNDTVFLMANGASGVSLQDESDKNEFLHALKKVAIILAQSIAADGEGATKLIEVRLKGGENLEQTRKAARLITLSPLVKSAIHGEDPNWGRILAKLGMSDLPEQAFQQLTLHVQDELIFEKGAPAVFDRTHLRSLLRKSKVEIEIDLKLGPHQATAWGCDLSKKYVEINTDYTT